MVLCYKINCYKLFSQVDDRLKGGDSISGCIMPLLHALSLLKCPSRSEKMSHIQRNGRGKTSIQLFRHPGKTPSELQCCSLPSVVCVLETEHQDLPWGTRCLSSWVLHKYALLQLNLDYFGTHQPKPGKHKGLSINLPNEAPAPPWPQILTAKAFTDSSFKGKLESSDLV